MGVIQLDSCIHHSPEYSHSSIHVQRGEFFISMDCQVLFLSFLCAGKTSISGQLSQLILHFSSAGCQLMRNFWGGLGMMVGRLLGNRGSAYFTRDSPILCHLNTNDNSIRINLKRQKADQQTQRPKYPYIHITED